MKKGASNQIRKDAVGGMPLSHRSAAFELQHTGKICHLCAAVRRDAFEADLGKHLGRRRRDI